MTQAFNLSQLANNLNTAGQLDATDGLVNAVPIANGGTGASSAASARTNLVVPTRTGGDASGTWGINITGNAATATSATSASTAAACSGNSLTATQLTSAGGSAPSYSARAWVNFNGTGVVTIRANGNVSSITDNGTGNYTVNFTTAMADADYAALVSGNDGTTNTNRVNIGVDTLSASSFRIRFVTPIGSLIDAPDVLCAVFR
jgi:hypothetical protein